MLKYARLALAIAITLTACFGQITTTGIHGIVRDPSGAIVPGAAIKLLDIGTSIEQSTVSSADGNFAYANLQAAKYRRLRPRRDFKLPCTTTWRWIRGVSR